MFRILSSRFTAIVVIFALVLPLIFLHETPKVLANSNNSTPNVQNFITEPPLSFNIGSSVFGTAGTSSLFEKFVKWISFKEENASFSPPPNRTNFALASNGGTASASSEYSTGTFPVSGANNGDRKGLNWNAGAGWNDNTSGSYPDWLQIDFDGTKTIDEIDVFTLQDNYNSPSEPTLTDTFLYYGITAFDTQYWNGSTWTTVPGGSITGNNHVWSQVTFSAVSTTKIRVVVNNSLADYSRIVELEAWGNSSTDAAFSLGKARLSPINETGGTNLYSRNFSWGTGLAGLSGRAGLNAGFGISYNSLVWIKNGNDIIFDPDNTNLNVSPGFRTGFPVIEGSYYDSDKSKNVYLMVAASGARVEFRQVAGSSDTFETADSSYVQLKVTGTGAPENLTLTVTGTSGTRMTYVWYSGAYRCTQITDTNGNYVSIAYDSYGKLQTVTDTLGRVISVGYDAGGYPTSIYQTWKDNNGAGANVTHTYATFAYANITINTSFSGLNVQGPANGSSMKVLQKITYADGSYTAFDYNGYAQAYKVSNYAADLHLLNYVKTNLDAPAANQTDCPRFSETRSWVENFNQDANGVAQEPS